MGMDSFAPGRKMCTSFVVQNVTPYENKTIVIFRWPIPYMTQKDLLDIPGVAESDIRASLLKGEIKHKFDTKDIKIIYSDIDLLQFNACQKAWLQSLGFTIGLDIGIDQLDGYVIDFIESQGGGGTSVYSVRNEIDLIGLQNGLNRVFYTPEIFINTIYLGNVMTIDVFHNGRKLANGIDYNLSESGGVGTGFNTVTLNFSPISSSVIRANYYVVAS